MGNVILFLLAAALLGAWYWAGGTTEPLGNAPLILLAMAFLVLVAFGMSIFSSLFPMACKIEKGALILHRKGLPAGVSHRRVPANQIQRLTLSHMRRVSSPGTPPIVSYELHVLLFSGQELWIGRWQDFGDALLRSDQIARVLGVNLETEGF